VICNESVISQNKEKGNIIPKWFDIAFILFHRKFLKIAPPSSSTKVRTNYDTAATISGDSPLFYIRLIFAYCVGVMPV